MYLLRHVVAFMVALAAVSNGNPEFANEITTTNSVKANLVQDATISGNEATRELTGLEGDEERIAHIGIWNTNRISERNMTTKCNRFTNWIERLFNPDVKKCPKKKKDDDEYYTRHLRT